MVGPRYIAVSLFSARLLPASDSNEAIFRDKILPSLQASCASCHGGSTPASSLSVADFASVLNGGKHGPAITPGSAASSLLIQYLRGEKTPKMPMGWAIPDATLAALAKAIDEMKPAATTPKHPNAYAAWLFTPPKPPAVPSTNRNDW